MVDEVLGKLTEVRGEVAGLGVLKHPDGVVAAAQEDHVVRARALGQFGDLALAPDVPGDLVDLHRDPRRLGERSGLGGQRVGLGTLDRQDPDLARR